MNIIVNGGINPNLPLTVAGIGLWLHTGRNYTLSSGKCSAWNDISSNGRNYSQSTAGKRFIWADSILHGRPAFQGEQTNRQLLSGPTTWITTTPYKQTIFCVCQCSEVTTINHRYVWWNGASTTNGSVELCVANNSNVLGRRLRIAASGGTSSINIGTDSAPTLNPEIWTAVVDTSLSSNKNKTWLNNGQLTQANVGFSAVSTGTSAVGRGPTANREWIGNLFEIIVYDVALTTAQISRVNKYLSMKYRIAIA